MSRTVLLLGAGASWAAPSARPLFGHVRRALTTPLGLPVADEQWTYLAPEALLSRLQKRGVDVETQLRSMLGGGRPNALHHAAARALKNGTSVWTPNFDELIEEVADENGTSFHRVLPGDNPICGCGRGHLLKVHGTLSRSPVIARSEDVLLPLANPWAKRLAADFEHSDLVVVGYAGADVDLRPAIRDALSATSSARWYGTPYDEQPLHRRFGAALASGQLQLMLSDRPDLDFLEWAARDGLAVATPAGVTKAALGPLPPLAVATPSYRPSALLRARVLDDFDGQRAHSFYRYAIRTGPDRRAAANAYFTSGLIHGTCWRPAALRLLDVAGGIDGLVWPHLYRQLYDTFNLPPAERWARARQALVATGDNPRLLAGAASAAKEVDPVAAIELAQRALETASADRRAADTAWATFTLSFAYRWLGDLDKALCHAAVLADGVDALAKPVWVAWGFFELGALAALRGDAMLGLEHMEQARDVFSAAGERRFVFDATCGALTALRLAGETDRFDEFERRAQRMIDDRERVSRFAREVLLVEQSERARLRGDLERAERGYRELSASQTLAQEILGLLGLAEVERQWGRHTRAAERALKRSVETCFGFGIAHATLSLALAGAIDAEAAEERITQCVFKMPRRSPGSGLARFLEPTGEHLLCFP